MTALLQGCALFISCVFVWYLIKRLHDEISFETKLRQRQEIDILTLKKTVRELEELAHGNR